MERLLVATAKPHWHGPYRVDREFATKQGAATGRK
jgi:hypothetical protein